MFLFCLPFSYFFAIFWLLVNILEFNFMMTEQHIPFRVITAQMFCISSFISLIYLILNAQGTVWEVKTHRETFNPRDLHRL